MSKSFDRRSFITGSATMAAAAALGTSAMAFAAEENSLAAFVAPETATVRAGYLSYFDWLGEAPVIDESLIVDEQAVDVVIVGAGASGMCALSAAENGASVAVIEKQPEDMYMFIGHDIGTLNSEYVLSKGGQAIDTAEFIQDWQRRNGDRTNSALTRIFAENSGKALDWILSHLSDEIIENCGVFAVPYPTEYPGAISGFKAWCCALHFQDDGTDWPDAAKTLMAAAKELGATWDFDTEAVVLEKDGERVSGVIAQLPDGTYKRYTAAKAVILAAGDYGGNPLMTFALNDEYRNFVEVRRQDWSEIRSMSGRTGDGQKMGCWAGAVMEPGPRASMGRAMGAGCFGDLAMIQMNAKGKRFMNEGIFGVWGNYFQQMRQPIGRIYAVIDSKWREFVQKNAPEHVYPGTGGWHDGGFLTTLDEELPKVLEAGAEGYKIRGCATYAANTLEELADYLELEGEVRDNFFASIERYNELAAAGKDTDFGKDAFLMEPISEPPFYCSTLSNEKFSLGLVELSGLVVDENQNCLTAMGDPIPGLYTVGNNCGGRFALQYHTPIAGISMGWATTMGYMLGKTTAAL